MADHIYDLSRRLDDGKWLCVGKAYRNNETGKVTMFIDPAKMKQALKGQKESFPMMMFSKGEPEIREPPLARLPHAGAKPPSVRQAPPIYTAPPETKKPSDDWPADFDDDIPF